jgi:hypothetical protein
MTTFKNIILDTRTFEALYHMTHIKNLTSILNHGLLGHGNSHQVKDISDNQVNNRRSRVEPIYGKAIHSYVPFYFNPKNAMLYRRKDKQKKIVILVFNKSLVLDNGAVFTDGNAASAGTSFYNNIKDLNKLNWSCLNDRSWCNHVDGKRTRMAEVLVPNHVGMDRLEKIVCNSHKTYQKLKAICSDRVTIELNHSFYF